MTKVIMMISKNGTVMFDCLNHSDDHDVCTIVSTLCNVLVEACFQSGHEPTVYNKGHVRIDITEAPYPTLETFRIVDKLLRAVAEQNPDFVKIY